MAIPLTTQVFNAFLGAAEGTNVLLLPDAFSSSGSVNVWMDKFGRVRSWGGYSALAGVPAHGNAFTGLFFVTIDEGGPWSWPTLPGKLLGYTEPWNSGSTDNNLVLSSDGGITWSTVAHAAGAGLLPDFAQFGNAVYITMPSSLGNYSYNADGSGTFAAVTNTQSPTPSASSGSAGALNGTYKYKLVSIHGTTGARKLASAPSTILSVSNKSVSLSWTADADTNQGGYEIYRTSGTGNLYYFVAYSAGRTTVAYTDNAADSAIFQNRVLEESGDAPAANCHFVEGHKGRLWWGATLAHYNRVWWSDAGLPTSVLDTNYLDFADYDNSGDVLTGMVGSFRDTLVVFTSQAVWTVSGTGSVIGYVADWNRVRSNARIGSVSHRSVVRVPTGARYVDEFGSTATTSGPTLAYWTPLGDIRLFDGDNDVIISTPVQDTARASDPYASRLICVVHDQDRNHIVWFYPTSGSAYCNAAIVWNYKWGVWYQWTGLDVAAATVMHSTTDANTVLIGRGNLGSSDASALARVYVLDESGGVNGSSFTATWQSKPLYGSDENGVPLLDRRKRWRWVDLRLATLSGSAAATVLTASAFDAITGNIAGGTSLTTTAATVQQKLRLQRVSGNPALNGDYPHTEGITLQLTSTIGPSSSNGWAVDGFALTYQVLPGQKRRMD